MTVFASPQPQFEQSDAGTLTRIGGWLFRRRTVIPLPLALAVLIVPERYASASGAVLAAGVALVAAGEGLRLWGVRHIGVISRTRSDRLGPLIASGPFAWIRNPLYVGNVALWAGFALSARLVWLTPVFVAILAVEYHAIVRWEERLLVERLGERYRVYASRVPRWIPGLKRGGRHEQPRPANGVTSSRLFSWRESVYSERGTLIAIVIGFALIWLKARAA